MIDSHCNYFQVLETKKLITNDQFESYGRVIYSISDDGESYWFSYWPEQLLDDIVEHIYGDIL
jgi:hypothetical protein